MYGSDKYVVAHLEVEALLLLERVPGLDPGDGLGVEVVDDGDGVQRLERRHQRREHPLQRLQRDRAADHVDRTLQVETYIK